MVELDERPGDAVEYREAASNSRAVTYRLRNADRRGWMKKKASVVAFMAGAIIMSITGRGTSLSWSEMMFVVGAVTATAASIILTKEVGWLDEDTE